MEQRQAKTLDPRTISDIVALTPLQEGMLFHYLKDSNRELYFEQLSIGISGIVNLDVFRRAWDLVVEANDILRTVFRWEKLKSPTQVVLKEYTSHTRYIDFAHLDEREAAAQLAAIKASDRKEGFDLREAAFRVTLCRIGAGKYEMIIASHHILYDGWSSGIILKEFFNAYDALAAGKSPGKPIKTPFKEFVHWVLQEQGQEETKRRQKKFWNEYLYGMGTDTPLPTEIPVKETRQEKGRKTDNPPVVTLPFSFAGKTREGLEDFTRVHGVTLAALLYGAWGILLRRYANSNDVVFGTTVAGRSARIKGIEDMVGLFINTVPLRMEAGHRGETVMKRLERLTQDLQTREAFEQTPLVTINEYLQYGSLKELFDTIVVIENYPLDIEGFKHTGGLTIDSYSAREATHYDLTVVIQVSAAEAGTLPKALGIQFLYRQHVFSEPIIQRLAAHFAGILRTILENPYRETTGVEMISPEEKRQILEEFNNTAAAYPRDKTLFQLFAAQVERTPDRVVLVGTNRMRPSSPSAHLSYISCLSYKELNHRAGNLAILLNEKGLNPGDIAAIMTERSLEMVIGIFGILHAGCAYLPINPRDPEERINYLLADSGAKFRVTAEILSHDINLPHGKKGTGLFRMKTGHCPVPTRCLAYIIYTSGSTGKPKGVMVDHASIVNTLCALEDMYPFAKEDVYLLKTSYLFDVSLAELFGWFMGKEGGKLAVLETGAEKDPGKIIEAIEKLHITHINFVPSMFGAFLDTLSRDNIGKISALRYIFLAGEALLPELVRKFLSLDTTCRLENIYGPTEAAIYASRYSLAEWDGGGDIPIGKPTANVNLYILDFEGGLQPVGVPGELFISGAGLARGYLNRPELTVETFLTHFNRSYMSCKTYNILNGTLNKIYKTGDLTRWEPEGHIRYLGRIDHQVKIRGFRIELGEIENQLFSHPLVKEAVVISHKRKNQDTFLCAYVVPLMPGTVGTGDTVDVSKLKEYLLEKLPSYMVPTVIITLKEMPLTQTGKINRQALPEPEVTSAREYIAPRNPVEEKLAEIWSQVLGTANIKIGIDDNFFEMGGHSLKAVGLINRIYKTFDIEIPLTKLFDIPTIRGQAALIAKLEKKGYTAVLPLEKREYYPLSAFQERMFVFQQLHPGDISYNISENLVLEGDLAKNTFERVLKQLVRRHETCRTSFHVIDDKPVQKIHDEAKFEIESVDAGNKAESELSRLISKIIRPFDLSHAPLLRVGLLKIEKQTHLLVFDLHHIIADGVSIGIFIKEFLVLYSGETLPPLKVQYKDYLEWKKQNKKAAASEIPYRETVLNLPLDFPRPAKPDYKGKNIRFTIAELENTTGLESVKENVTLYMVLLAAFNVFLARISGQENIVVGSPVAGRQHPDLEGIVGLFINPLVLQNFPQGHKRFSEFLLEVRDTALEAFANQDNQYESLMADFPLNRDTARNPFYDVMFVLQNMEMPEVKIPGLNVIPLREYQAAKLDLTLYYEENGSAFNLEYSTSLFKPETIERFIRYFKQVINEIRRDPHKLIKNIDILPPEERQRILVDFNETAVPYDVDKTIIQVIQEQVERTPEHIALVGKFLVGNQGETASAVYTSGETAPLVGHLTFRELNERANGLAWVMQSKGVGPGTLVGILLERSLEIVIGLLGILKAGGAYLPIDPENPSERIGLMLSGSGSAGTAGIKALYTHTSILEKKKLSTLSREKHIHVLAVDQLMPVTQRQISGDFQNYPPAAGPNDIIYIIFTSGSTGIPKGAGVIHRGFMNLMQWFVGEFALGPTDTNLVLTSLSFDLTQKNFYAPLMTGGTLYLPGINYFDPGILLKEIKNYNVTWINCTPSMFHMLVQREETLEQKRLSSLRYVFLGGEPISIQHFISWLESGRSRAEIVNTYGPTECTDICASYRIRQPRRFLEESVPVGKPVYNVQLFVLDNNRQPLPEGIPGELTIGGAGVGIGYVNDDALTAQKFFTHDFGDGVERLLYRTGDRVKWQDDGNIQFLGRVDFQVKIRGNRVEIGEIENRLLKHPDVKETIVAALEEKDNEKFLCAYIVPNKPAEGLNAEEIREYLSRHLPAYMVPSYVMILAQMPLNPSGKIDRGALPAPDPTSKERYVPPRNDIEIRLSKIWAEILGIDENRVGVNDNFFQSGGHSLKAAALIGRIHKTFSVEVPLAVLFDKPTVKGIAQHIEASARSRFYSIKPVEKREYYPVSSAQKRLFILRQIDPESTVYNIPALFRLQGKVDRNRCEEGFRKLTARHESLRTSFVLINEEPVQRIHDEVEITVDYLLTAQNTDGNKKIAKPPMEIELLIKEFLRPFDLARPPLLRAAIIENPAGDSLLMVDMHHIISDGESMGVFIKEFSALFRGEALPELRLQYTDFTRWQYLQSKSHKVKQQELFWRSQFAGEIPVLSLPTDRPRPALQQFSGNRLNFEIPKETVEKIKQSALNTGTTLFMILYSLYALLLSKLSGQEDIVIGTAIAGRGHPDLENIIGMFVNTLPLRIQVHTERTYPELLAEIKHVIVTAFENQEYQYEDLVDNSDVKRDLSRNPLFDVLFVLQNPGIHRVQLPGLMVTPLEIENNTSKFDITLQCIEEEESLQLSFEYGTHLFKADTIRRWIGYFYNITASVVENPAVKLSGIEIISPEEKRQILEKFNNTATAYPREKTIHRLFREQVTRTPDRLALLSAVNAITYSELNRKTRQLAGILKKKGAGLDTIVGIMVERSVEMVVGVLGILQAGAAYLPIDRQYPEKRIQYVIKDSRISILLTDREMSQNQVPGEVEVIRLDIPGKYENNISLMDEEQCRPENLAYILYTSGSTGRPKGVLVDHRPVIRLVKNTNYIKFVENRRILQTVALEFDVSTFEMWGTLLNGMSLILEPKEVIINPAGLKSAIKKYDIHTLWLTTPLFNQMVMADVEIFAGITNLLVGGDALSSPHINMVKNRYPGLNVINGYGPTENTTFSTTFLIEKEYKTSIPIGTPIANSTAVVMDRGYNLLPVGVTGELLVGGDGLSRGYLNHPELTAEKFLTLYNRSYKSYMSYISCKTEHKLTRTSNRIYKTGDLARWQPEGNLEYLGRIDHQVKIRGFRVELGEIESRLLGHKAIQEAVVLVKQRGETEKYLCAYLEIKPGSKSQDIAAIEKEIQNYLGQGLPSFMVPSSFVIMDRMPLTSNGKIDRKALPEPRAPEPGSELIPPRNGTEEKLTSLWSELLGISVAHIGIDTDFFAAGGHSLKAALLAARLSKEFNIKITLTEIFKAPTIRKLAKTIRDKARITYSAVEPVEAREYYPLSSVQKRLYVLQQTEINSTAYNMPTAFTLKGNFDKSQLYAVFIALIRRHESLRTSFPKVKEEPVQRIREQVRFQIEPLTSDTIKGFIRPFDLSGAPLLRLGILEIESNEHLLVLDMHHIISDGISISIIINEFMSLYRGETLPSLRLRYRDYSEKQRHDKHGGVYLHQEGYWKQQFQEEPPYLELPTENPGESTRGYEGSHLMFTMPKDEAAVLKSLADTQGTTLYMVLLALYNIFLSKICNQEDILVGTPTAGRWHADLEPIVGMFVNTIVLRNYPHGDKTFLAFLSEIKGRTLEAFDNQDYQYEDLVELVHHTGDAGGNPLFKTMFVLQNVEIPELEIPGLKLTPREQETGTAKFPLLLQASEKEEGIVFDFEYSTRLFKPDTLSRYIGYFKAIAAAVRENPGIRLACIDMVSDEEKRFILEDFNRTTVAYPRDKTIHGLFREQAARTPDTVAVVSAVVSLTYGELEPRTLDQARRLKENGVAPDTIVGIKAERSAEMALGILAILTAGAAYLPIDPGTPAERVQYLLKDCNVNVLVTGGEDTGKKYAINERIVNTYRVVGNRLACSEEFETCNVENNWQVHPENLAARSPQPVTNPFNLAYVIYTSGSTGKPKGVLVMHRNVVRLVKNTNYVEFKPNQRIMQTGALEFDASTFEIWGALLNGLTLYLMPKESILTPAGMKETLYKYGIDTIWLTSPLFNQMVLADVEIFAGLTNLLVGGDALSPAHIEKVRKRYPGLKVINGYGPTENTTFSTTFLIDREYKTNIPIGKPIANSTAFIIDESGNLQPVGVTGELCVGGDGVSRGYLNHPELTAEKFLTHFNRSHKSYMFYISYRAKHKQTRTSNRIYKTGDLARWRSDGTIEFLGRKDHQVKIRGYRVEPGEIENRLLNYKGIKEAVVLVKQHPDGEKYLCAYTALETNLLNPANTLLETEIRNYLQQTMPNYMVPSYFVLLEKLPLTPNGKIDRKALPEPVITAAETYTAPRNSLENKLQAIWQDLLKVEKIGIHDDFFAIGGHSLKVLNLVNAIEKEFQVRIDFQEVFEAPTIAELGESIRQAKPVFYETLEVQPRREYYELSYPQKRLWLLYQLDPENPAFNLPTRITLEEPVDEAHVRKALEQLIERHESFRTYFKNLQGKVVQIISEQMPLQLAFHDLVPLPGPEREGRREQLFREESLRPFKLENPPLFRTKLIRCTPGQFDVILNMHHIITDGWSMEILGNEFLKLYESYKNGGNGVLGPLRHRYIDYVYWYERLLADKELMQRAKEFWETRLKGEIPILELPYDKPKKNMTTKKSAAYEIVIPEALHAALKEIAIQQKASVFMVLLAAMNILLNRLTGQSDILLGVPGAARQHQDLKNIVGFFVNTLVLRNSIDTEESVLQFLGKVQDNMLKVLEYQSYPLELICGEYKIKYPEISVFFNMVTFGNGAMDSVRNRTARHIPEVQDTKFDLVCYLGEFRDGMTISTHYYRELFEPQTIEQIMRMYLALLEDIIRDPGKKIADIQYDTPGKTKQLKSW